MKKHRTGEAARAGRKRPYAASCQLDEPLCGYGWSSQPPAWAAIAVIPVGFAFVQAWLSAAAAADPTIPIMSDIVTAMAISSFFILHLLSAGRLVFLVEASGLVKPTRSIIAP